MDSGLGGVEARRHGQSRALDYQTLYVRRRFITPEAVRQSIAAVVNRLFEARLPQLWGEGTRPVPPIPTTFAPGIKIY